MTVEVVSYSEDWPVQFAHIAGGLSHALDGVPVVAIEHVGSTAVPGLAAKPILDIDIIVERQHVRAAIAALANIGYVHRGDLGMTDREAFTAPDSNPRRHVYVCVQGTVHLRNHLAVREVLRARPDLRELYGAVKLALSLDPDIDIPTYIARKSDVLQDVLAASELSDDEKRLILDLNARS
ncbi:MAG: GrpB family protein [Gordonia sp. (in: high G+C Gram-positive bacteria)]|uniref:GrpB family protein n=1 Tax=Gordonia sp. (in: high G+C Gram-positive bacteria) TaxID=84139 RepID=UPI0039E42576